MKLKRSIFILLALVGILVLPSSVWALDLNLTYNDTWKKCSKWTDVFPSYDSDGNMDGYLYIFNGGIIKQDLNNKVVYEREFDDSNIYVEDISDDVRTVNYKINGSSDILITVTADDGNLVFEKQYGGNGDESWETYFKSYNNEEKHDGYIVLVESNSSDLGVEPGLIMIKYDLKGNILWQKNVNNYLKSNYLYYTNGNVVETIFSHGSTTLRKNDIDWNIVWTKDTGIYINSINYSYNKNGVIDGVVVAGGFDSNGDTVGVIAKYDLDGNLVFKTNYDVSSDYIDVISSYLPDGSYDGYIVTAMSSDNRTLLVKYDLNGKKTYEKVYSNDGNIWFMIINNFDSDGKQNGYLLYSSASLEKRQLGRKNEAKNQIATYEVCSDNLVVAKYTYDIFPVAKEEADGGTITVKSDAYPGEIVKVKVAVKDGYTLARIVVKDENGKEIEVNSDGTFVMPEGKVTVSAIYKRLSNPNTVSAAYMVLGIVLLIAVGSLIVLKQKNKESM